MVDFLLFLFPAAVAGVLAFALTPVAGVLAARVGALDKPGPRKIHERSIPRLGGLAVIAAASLALTAARIGGRGTWMIPRELAIAITLGVVPVAVISVYDDIKSARPSTKFMVQLAGAIIAVLCGARLGDQVHLFGQTIALGWLTWPISVLWIVGVTNAFNLIDGLDGLSAGLALISAASLAGVFVIAHQTAMASVTLVLAGALAGFLPYNLHPARLFLGDTGATSIGFVLSVFALRGGSTLSAGFATLLPMVLLGMPIADTLVAILRRIVRKLENRSAGGVFSADRNHIHHRLLALGITHRNAVLILYGAGLLVAGCGFVSVFFTAHDAALLLLALFLAGFVGVSRLGYDEFALIRRGIVLRIYEVPVLRKSLFMVFVDLVVVAFAAYCAVGLKSDDWALVAQRETAFAMVGILAPTTVIVFWGMRVYTGTWRLASIEDFVRASCAALVAAFCAYIVRLILSGPETSESLFLIYAFVSLVLLNGNRVSYRVLMSSKQRADNGGVPVLVYGAGRGGFSAVRELFSNSEAGMRVVAFIDDDPLKHGKSISGIPIAGTLDDLRAVIARAGATALIVSSGKIPFARLDQARRVCAAAGVSFLRMQITFDEWEQEFSTGRLAVAVNERPR